MNRMQVGRNLRNVDSKRSFAPLTVDTPPSPTISLQSSPSQPTQSTLSSGMLTPLHTPTSSVSKSLALCFFNLFFLIYFF